LFATATTANASLISQRSTSFVERPLFSSIARIASAGAMVNSMGARAAPPHPEIRPRTGRPSRFARSALMRTRAAAPSLRDDAFAAVTVPSFLNTGRSVGILSGRALFGPSSSATTAVSPFFRSISTGTISARNAPDCCAATARRVDSIAYSSWAAREMPCVVAQCSAHIPMCCWPYTSQRPSWIMPSTSSTLPIRAPVRVERS